MRIGTSESLECLASHLAIDQAGQAEKNFVCLAIWFEMCSGMPNA